MQDEPANRVINLQEALVYTAGDREMLSSIATVFLDEGPKQLQVVRDRAAASDGQGVREAAHKLKGSIVIFGAQAATVAVIAVEDAARNEDHAQIACSMKLLESEMAQLLAAVEQLSCV